MGSAHGRQSPENEKVLAEIIRVVGNKEVAKFIKEFYEDTKNGKKNREKFKKKFMECHPHGNASEFADHVFRAFDQNDNGILDCRQFIYETIIRARDPPPARDKVGWAFKIYNRNNQEINITRNDIREIFEAVDQIFPEKRRAQEVEKLFRSITSKNEVRISPEHFRRAAKACRDLYEIPLNAMPTGEMTGEQFRQMYRQGITGDGDVAQFADHVFRTFEYSGTIGYQEFFWAAVMTSYKASEADKLKWTYEVFGKMDGSENLSKEDMTNIFQAVEMALPEDVETRRLIEKAKGEFDNLASFMSAVQISTIGKSLLEVLTKVIPAGGMARDDFVTMYQEKLPVSRQASAARFAEHVFRTFVKRQDRIDYEDFFWTAVATRRGRFLAEQLECAFDIYDVNGNGTIERNEMLEVFTAVNNMLPWKKKHENKTVREMSERTFLKLDTNKDGTISKTEFQNGAKVDPELYEMFFQVDPLLTASGEDDSAGGRQPVMQEGQDPSGGHQPVTQEGQDSSGGHQPVIQEVQDYPAGHHGHPETS